MKKIISLLSLYFIIVHFSTSQESQFSQYYAASLFLNPAFSGISNDPSLHTNHKRQMQQLQILNELTQVSFILPLKPNGKLERSIGGVGVMVYNEKSGIDGVFQKDAAFLNYAHNLKFGVLTSYIISIGAQIGYEQRSVNFSELTWGSQYNIFYGFDDTRPAPVTEFDERTGAIVVNSGAMYYYNPDRNYMLHKFSAFAGVSVTNLNRPNKSFNIQSDEREPMLWKYNGGIEFKVNKLYITPSLLTLYTRRNAQFNAGLNLSYVPNADRYRALGPQILFGAWYRYRDSFIFMGGLKFNSITIRGSYDLNSKLFIPDRTVDLAQNSVEISIQYSLSKKQGIRKVSNPLF
ncbi:MAG: PorP/SprF family type IX secretion system membrane protein [Ekhidna sp.]